MSIIKHVTLQKIVAHDFRYDPRTSRHSANVSCVKIGAVRTTLKGVNQFLSVLATLLSDLNKIR